MSKLKNNVKFWKTLVGLPMDFPDLYSIKDQDISELMVIDPEQKDEIFKSMVANQFTIVEVQQGWGLTTLFHYLLKEFRDTALERLIIPVNIDLEEKPFSEEITPAILEDQIKRQIISTLIEESWETRLNTDYYFGCINFEEGEMELDTFKAKVRNFLFKGRKPAYRTLCSNFPWLKESLQDIVNYMLKNFRIQTALFYHFPSNVDEQKMLDLTLSVKSLYEKQSDYFEYAAIREIYLCSPAVHKDLDREFKRPFYLIKYPLYTPAQIYTMLVKRYSPQIPGSKGRNTTNLSAVFSEQFVRNAWSEKFGIVNIISAIEKDMEHRLTCLENEVPFRLEPIDKNTDVKKEEFKDIAANHDEHIEKLADKPNKETHDKPKTENKVKRRFIRKKKD